MVAENEALTRQGKKDNIFKLDIFTQTANAGVWEYDFVNDLFSYPETKTPFFKGFSWEKYLTMVHPADLHIPVEGMQRLIRNECNDMRGTYRLLLPSGQYRHVDIMGMVYERDSSGKPLSMIGLRWDISEQRQKDLDIKASKEILELTLHHFKIFPWIISPQEDSVKLLSETTHPFPQQFPLRYFLNKYVAPSGSEEYQRWLDLLSEKLELGETFNYRFHFNLPEKGVDEWIDITGMATEKDAEGHIVRNIGVTRIITEEYQRERLLTEAKNMLEFSLQGSDIVAWEFTPPTGMLHAPSIQIDGYGSDIPLSVFIDNNIHPDYQAEARNTFRSLSDGSNDSCDLKTIAYASVTGKQEWVHIKGTALRRDHRGRVTKLFGTMRIVSGEVKREQELIRLRESAEESNRLKSAFLANMSHEIRTPLNAIVGFSKLIPLAETPEEAEEYNEIITTNNDLLLQLINDILDISRIEAGKITFHNRQVDVISMFCHLEQIYLDKKPEQVALITELPDESYTIFSDMVRLTQVISNFLNNAIKFTANGSITMGYSKPTPGRVRFFVRDTGIGIDAEGQKHIFERFTKLNSFAQGTGLGLSICQTIAERMGGEIGVSSTPGSGSEFWINIPEQQIRNIPEVF